LPLGWRIRATAAALLFPPLVHLVSLQRLMRAPPARGPRQLDLDDAALAAYVDRLLRRLPWPWRHTCLKRSSTLFVLLRRAGRPVQLCVGARRGSTGEFQAHAWLTMNGQVYLESDPQIAPTHTVIARFPAEANV
jgi:hypothetical protein